MLEEIRIRGLGVIEDAEIAFDPGLTVVTGETGAGKTMVVTGLSLLVGARADAGLVRSGRARAVVEGRVRAEPTTAAVARARDAGAELDEDQTLLLARTLSAEGRSRAHVGGAAVPVGVLSALGPELLALHGQTDQLQLLRPGRQRELLDRYAGDPVGELLSAYRQRYERLGVVEDRLRDIVGRARERAQEADRLRFGLEEIEAVAPVAGEGDALAAEQERLSHADGLRSAAEQAHAALAGEEDPASAAPDVLGLLGAARKGLEAVRGHDDALGALADRVAEIAALAADTAAELASYAAGIDTDPARLQSVAERRAELAGLTRKYGDTVEEVLAWSRDAAETLAELTTSDEQVAALQAERDELRSALGELAGQLSAARAAAAERLGDAVTTELCDLAMPHAQVQVQLRRHPVPDGQPGLEVDGDHYGFGPFGVDEVELVLRPHAGAPDRSLQRAASGGELSRVMLAVEVALAGVDPVPTLVFDEVDAGVGGKAAVEVGRRLARLAETAQVVVVTHLPQVAAFADRHYLVRKSDDGSVTRSGLVRLDPAGRVDELARMLAGLEGSATARAHAEELLAAAAAARSDRAPRPGRGVARAPRRAGRTPRRKPANATDSATPV